MLLKLDWYLESPIDFEHKNYVLLDYIQKVDEAFKDHKLSPYLMWNQQLVSELTRFELNRKSLLCIIEKKELLFTNGNVQLKKIGTEDTEHIKTIIEVIDYSLPILESKVKLGYTLLKKYPQVLW